MGQASQLKARNRADSFKAPPFTDDEIKSIIQLYNDSNSMGVIADQYPGRTRNSIAGLIHRQRRKANKLEAIPKKSLGRFMITRPNGSVAAQPKVQLLKTPKQQPEPEPKPKKERIRLKLIEHPTAVTFAELDKHHCKYPLGDPKRSDFRFCGGRRLPGKPYCTACTEIAETTRVYNRVSPNRALMLAGKPTT